MVNKSATRFTYNFEQHVCCINFILVYYYVKKIYINLKKFVYYIFIQRSSSWGEQYNLTIALTIKPT